MASSIKIELCFFILIISFINFSLVIRKNKIVKNNKVIVYINTIMKKN